MEKKPESISLSIVRGLTKGVGITALTLGVAVSVAHSVSEYREIRKDQNIRECVRNSLYAGNNKYLVICLEEKDNPVLGSLVLIEFRKTYPRLSAVRAEKKEGSGLVFIHIAA
ncbi:MAG TPA: hypothetical protein VI957_00195 [Candidatus Paceibacterota bacterium]